MLSSYLEPRHGTIRTAFCNYLFPVFRVSRATQILIQECSKDGLDLGGINLHMVVPPTSQRYCKEEYVSPVARCLSDVVSLNPTSNCLLKFLKLLDVVMYLLLDEVDNGW